MIGMPSTGIVEFNDIGGGENSSLEDSGLRQEAETLVPTITWIHQRYLQQSNQEVEQQQQDQRYQHDHSQQLSDYDVVGIYLLLYLSIRRPRSWCGGPLSQSIVSKYNADTLLSPPVSIRVVDVPGLIDALGGPEFLHRRLGGGDRLESVTVLDVFNELKIVGIKKNGNDVANRCIVLWAYNRCPLCLMFRIPSPMDVLRQQARGQRVVTVFATMEGLSRHHTAMLSYMDGELKHARDAFEFTLHDLTHMEKFALDGDTYEEQVGFFRCVLGLSGLGGGGGGGGNKLKQFFVGTCEYDERLWRELEYVISDMNCYCTHLMQYMLAKMVLASERILAAAVGAVSVREHVEERWRGVVVGMSMSSEAVGREEEVVGEEEEGGVWTAYGAAVAMVSTAFRERGAMTAGQGEALRAFFRGIGREVVKPCAGTATAAVAGAATPGAATEGGGTGVGLAVN